MYEIDTYTARIKRFVAFALYIMWDVTYITYDNLVAAYTYDTLAAYVSVLRAVDITILKGRRSHAPIVGKFVEPC
jgi:hypothetical protein